MKNENDSLQIMRKFECLAEYDVIEKSAIFVMLSFDCTV
jgi:hypothetical protein